MAIGSQLSTAKKKKKNVKMIIYSQLSLAKKTLKWLSTVRVVINCLTIRELYKYKVVFLFIMLKGWYYDTLFSKIFCHIWFWFKHIYSRI